MTQLLLIRHAETDMAGRFCGHSDPELNARGHRQTVDLLTSLSPYSVRRVYSSDLQRARQTAEVIATHFRAQLHLRPGLREIYFGLWESLSWNEIETRHPLQAKIWAENYPNSSAPEGESSQEFEERVRAEFTFLLREAAANPIGVITHGGFIRVALARYCKMSEEEAWIKSKDYASVVALDTALIRDATENVRVRGAIGKFA